MNRHLAILLSVLCLWTPLSAKKQAVQTPFTTKDYLMWAQRLADSEMKRNSDLWMADGVSKPKWDYTQGLMAESFLQLYHETEKTAYLNYVKGYANYFILPNGTIRTYKKTSYNLDRVEGGIFLFDLYDLDRRPQYLMAIDTLRSQLATQPRTQQGGFWHKQIYEHQMWLDGLYMAEPFYARYTFLYSGGRNHFLGDSAAYSDIARQFLIVDEHTRDKKTGLNLHGWDESKQQKWANPITGCSPNFWGRSIGWYVMALVDVLDYMPLNQPERPQLIQILQRVTAGLVKVQDKKQKLWYQLPTLPKVQGNYLESSASIMYIYALAKGARMGYLPAKYLDIADEAFQAYINYFVKHNEKIKTYDITHCCAVAGLGGNPYRSGTIDYYIHERVRDNDPKTVGPFILTCLEMMKSHPQITVAQDGSGDYKTIQEAINAIPDYSKVRVLIHIKPGIYHENIIIPQTKTMVTLRGDNPFNTIITSNRSAHTLGATGVEVGTSGSSTFYTGGNDLLCENLTFENSAGEVGQAVAAHVAGDRVIFRNCRFLGNQDTLFTFAEGSRQYYKDCYIEGTTDFIFGWSRAVFDNCEIRSKKDSYVTAASTPEGQNCGYLFLNCRLTADPGVTKCYLGRPWRIHAQTVYKDCQLGSHIRPEGWYDWKKPEANDSAFYAEYHCYGPGAQTAERVVWSHQLTDEEAEHYTPQELLAGKDKWNPAVIRCIFRRK